MTRKRKQTKFKFSKYSKVSKKYLRGFTIDAKNESLDYYGDEDVLISLKKKL